MLNLWLALLGRRHEERLLKGWMFFYVTSFKQTHDLSWSGLKGHHWWIDWADWEEVVVVVDERNWRNVEDY